MPVSVQYIVEKIKDQRICKIVGYSYGSMIAIEIVRRLETHGFVGELLLLDGSPDYMKSMKAQIQSSSEDAFQNNILLDMLRLTNSPCITEVNSKFVIVPYEMW